MKKIKDFFEIENDNAEEALFRIHEEITCSNKTMQEVKEQATDEAFTIGICSCAIFLNEYNGLGAIFEMHHDVAPYLSGSLQKLGYKKEAEYFQKVMDVFPDFTDFTSDYHTQEYCDVLNVLEGRDVKEDCGERRLLELTKEQLGAMSEGYANSMKDLEKYVEDEWRVDMNVTLEKLEHFARKHFDVNIWKNSQ